MIKRSIILLVSLVSLSTTLQAEPFRASQADLAAMSLDRALDLIAARKSGNWVKDPAEFCVLNADSSKATTTSLNLSRISAIELSKMPEFVDGEIFYPPNKKMLAIQFPNSGAMMGLCSVSFVPLTDQEARDLGTAFVRITQTDSATLNAKINELFAVDLSQLGPEELLLEKVVTLAEGRRLVDQYVNQLAQGASIGKSFQRPQLNIGFSYGERHEQQVSAKKSFTTSLEKRLSGRSGSSFIVEMISKTDHGMGEQTFTSRCFDVVPLFALAGQFLADRCEHDFDSMSSKSQIQITQAAESPLYFPVTEGKVLNFIGKWRTRTDTDTGDGNTTGDWMTFDYYEKCFPSQMSSINVAAGNFDVIELSCASVSFSNTGGMEFLTKLVSTKWISPEFGIVIKSSGLMDQQSDGRAHNQRTFMSTEVTRLSR